MDYASLPKYEITEIDYQNGFIDGSKTVTDFNVKSINIEMFFNAYPSNGKLLFNVKSSTEVKNLTNEVLCQAALITTFAIYTNDINSVPIDFFLLLINKGVSHLQGFVEFQSRKQNCIFGIIPDPAYSELRPILIKEIAKFSN